MSHEPRAMSHELRSMSDEGIPMSHELRSMRDVLRVMPEVVISMSHEGIPMLDEPRVMRDEPYPLAESAAGVSGAVVALLASKNSVSVKGAAMSGLERLAAEFSCRARGSANPGLMGKSGTSGIGQGMRHRRSRGAELVDCFFNREWTLLICHPERSARDPFGVGPTRTHFTGEKRANGAFRMEGDALPRQTRDPELVERASSPGFASVELRVSSCALCVMALIEGFWLTAH